MDSDPLQEKQMLLVVELSLRVQASVPTHNESVIIMKDPTRLAPNANVTTILSQTYFFMYISRTLAQPVNFEMIPLLLLISMAKDYCYKNAL